MAEKFTGKQEKGEHVADISNKDGGQVILNTDERAILSYKGSEPPIEPPTTKKGKK